MAKLDKTQLVVEPVLSQNTARRSPRSEGELLDIRSGVDIVLLFSLWTTDFTIRISFQTCVDPAYKDMFENGNYRRRRRMKRPYKNSICHQPYYADAYPTTHVHLGNRNLFKHPPTPYIPPAYPRYDTRWIRTNSSFSWITMKDRCNDFLSIFHRELLNLSFVA